MGTGITPLSSIQQPLQALMRFLSSLKRGQRHIGTGAEQTGSDAPRTPLPTLAASSPTTPLIPTGQGAEAATVPGRKRASTYKGRHLYVAASQPTPKGETADLFATPFEKDDPAGLSQPLKPLRIVHSRCGTDQGKLLISGRMADVCAELDRMAAREAALAYG